MGRVLAYEPPDRVVFSWDISPHWQVETDPRETSEVEVRFIAEAPERTRVELEHRHLDRHGDGWEGLREGVAAPTAGRSTCGATPISWTEAHDALGTAHSQYGHICGYVHSAMTEGRARMTVDELLSAARSRLQWLDPDAASDAVAAGAVLIDIRSERQRARDGGIPDAHFVPRNVLEWRLDPASSHVDPAFGGDINRHVILLCDEGYQSSLAAATLRQRRISPSDRRGRRLPGLACRWASGGSPSPQVRVSGAYRCAPAIAPREPYLIVGSRSCPRFAFLPGS